MTQKWTVLTVDAEKIYAHQETTQFKAKLVGDKGQLLADFSTVMNRGGLPDLEKFLAQLFGSYRQAKQNEAEAIGRSVDRKAKIAAAVDRAKISADLDECLSAADKATNRQKL